MIITIDGPAGSGKSSTARAVAKKLHIEYIDSGALYRAITLLFLKSTDEEAFFEKLDQHAISFRYVEERFEVFVDGVDVTSKLRQPAVDDTVSTVAAMPRVRSFVNDLMRQVVKTGVYIAEGRDLGTAVFPEAQIKFFLKADLDERAKRRFLELQERKVDTTLNEVRQNIAHRDNIDSNRESDPLKKATDAIVVDTTDMEFDEQVQVICNKITQEVDI